MYPLAEPSNNRNRRKTKGDERWGIYVVHSPAPPPASRSSSFSYVRAPKGGENTAGDNVFILIFLASLHRTAPHLTFKFPVEKSIRVWTFG